MREIFDRYLAALSRTERMPLRDLALYQQELLARLVRHARGLDFYPDRLECLFSKDGALDLSRWNEVPILTRADVKAHGAAMRASMLAPELGGISDAETSGSTGMPLPIAINGLVFIAANALFTRMARSFPYGYSAKASRRCPLTAAAARAGRLPIRRRRSTSSSSLRRSTGRSNGWRGTSLLIC